LLCSRRKIRDKKATAPVRFERDGQLWEVVYKTADMAYAVKLNKKGSPVGIIERFYEQV
jgi:hypothetical protein